MAPLLEGPAGTPRPTRESAPQPALPHDVLQQLIEEVRRHIPHDRSAAFLSLDQLTRYVARSSGILETRGVRSPSSTADQRSGGLAPWQAKRVERFISDNIDAPIRIADLASLVSLCSSHFCRAFGRHFGETPHGYVMRRRVEHARHLMTTTQEPLSQIALMCGLSDQAHLSRLFRRHLGTTPSNWRRQSVSEAAC